MTTTIYAGQRITAGLLQQAIPLAAFKTASQSLQSQTTPQNDNDLHVPVSANGTYQVDGEIFWDSGSGQGYKGAWAVPSGATFLWDFHCPVTGNTAGQLTASSQCLVAGQGIGSVFSFRVRGLLIAGGTAGTLQYQFAQQTSGAFNTTTDQGSWLSLLQVA